METIIKNIHLLRSILSESAIERLEEGALQFRRFARITFKIIYFKDDTLTIEVRQDKSPAENYLSAADLISRTKDLFSSHILPMNIKVNVNATPFREPIVEIVTPEYIRHFMTVYKVKVKELALDTGVDATNISAWMNGVREMSQPVKAMFYYYFESAQQRIAKRGRGYKVDIVPNLIDPNETCMLFAKKFAGAIAEIFESDITAQVRFITFDRSEIYFHIVEAKAGAWYSLDAKSMRRALTNEDDWFSHLIKGFIELIEQEKKRMFQTKEPFNVSE